ncbi:uncharacterized protein KY384_001839 [Bacidia gigantensis]|uniref:uncharacterized protein n=1 Tax=Bacidia gigantensis TaxID=2732470 RepID=UPI001D041A07|nr:uncharacterized protein KY384_001839 [Bacidia gigantensis]KAG8533056.1 hypothetical protein KY384_001839 [Bacidia gigantensis]
MTLPFFLVAALCLLLNDFTQAYTKLSDSSLKAIPDPGNDFDIKSGKLLAPILQPRVPGSDGSAAVLKHFADFFKNDLPSWKVTYQNSTSKTPVTGDRVFPFVNMVATRQPPWTNPGEVSYLTLVAHYDSKMEPEGFIGAIDSAAPCAMLMHVARSLETALVKKWSSMNEVGMKMEGYDGGVEEHQGVQIIFLDGEEAFGHWSAEDSIYGAKSLAAEMEATFHPALSTYHNALSSISLFLLLDLLGAANPTVPSYFKTTHWAYKNLAALANRLHSSKKEISPSVGRWFPDSDKTESAQWGPSGIEDDHLPFMARGVEVLHIIPNPFPWKLWHQIEDDGEHLDLPTCKDWAVLITAFAAEWLDLNDFVDASRRSKESAKDDRAFRERSEL